MSVTPAENLEEGADLPEKKPEAPTTVEVAQIEEMAREQGWSPDKGDLSALEFPGRGREFRDKLFKEVKQTRAENAKLYDMFAEHITSVNRKEQNEARQAIEQQIAEATEAGDTAKVLELSKKLAEPQPAPKDAPKSDPTDDPKQKYVKDWIAQNQWFEKNPEMEYDAKGFYSAEMARLGYDDPEEILPAVEKRIKKLHPDYFKPASPNANREPGAEKGGTKKTAKSGGLKRSDLTEAEALHFEGLVNAGISEEKLLKSIEKQRATYGQ